MSHQEIENSEFEIEVEKKKFKASILKRPLNSKKISEIYEILNTIEKTTHIELKIIL